MHDLHSVLMIAVMAVITASLRILPFLIFGGKRKVPEFITYLGKTLPYAVMGMLVIYCVRNVSFTAYPFGLPEIISIGVVFALHLWKGNTLLSVIGSTACYMLLVQLVF